MRPQLKPTLRRAWRGPDSLQLGVSSRGAVLEGLTRRDVDLLDHLAAGDSRRPAGATFAGPRAHALLDALRQAGLLVEARTDRRVLARLGAARHRLAADAAAWSLARAGAGDGWDVLAPRARRHVVVTDGGRTGQALAATLTGAGVGSVLVEDARPVSPGDVGPGGASPRDVGRSRSEVAGEVGARLLGEQRPAGAVPAAPPDVRATTTRPDLVVLVEHAVADAQRAGELHRAGVAHLPVVLGEAGAAIGPLVVPGSGGPCLTCLDLHRGERDPAYPWVLPQLLAPAGPGTREGTHEETALSVVVAGLAALQVLGHLDGETPPALGATLEISLPGGLTALRPWPTHPGCACATAPEPHTMTP